VVARKSGIHGFGAGLAFRGGQRCGDPLKGESADGICGVYGRLTELEALSQCLGLCSRLTLSFAMDGGPFADTVT
jgi:hypothetical protein